MKRTVYAMAAVMVMMVMSGCAQLAVMQYHKAEVIKASALKLRAMEGGAKLSLDLLQLDPGYWEAWATHPWLMGGALVVDSAATVAIANEAKGQLEDDSDPAPAAPASQITTGGGDVFIISNGGTITSTRTSTMEGGAE